MVDRKKKGYNRLWDLTAMGYDSFDCNSQCISWPDKRLTTYFAYTLSPSTLDAVCMMALAFNLNLTASSIPINGE